MEVKSTKDAYIQELEKEVERLKRDFNDIQQALALVLCQQGPITIHDAARQTLSREATVVASVTEGGETTLALVNGPADTATWRRK